MVAEKLVSGREIVRTVMRMAETMVDIETIGEIIEEMTGLLESVGLEVYSIRHKIAYNELVHEYKTKKGIAKLLTEQAELFGAPPANGPIFVHVLFLLNLHLQVDVNNMMTEFVLHNGF